MLSALLGHTLVTLASYFSEELATRRVLLKLLCVWGSLVETHVKEVTFGGQELCYISRGECQGPSWWSNPHTNHRLPAWVCVALFSFQSISKYSRSTPPHSTDRGTETQSREMTWARPHSGMPSTTPSINEEPMQYHLHASGSWYKKIGCVLWVFYMLWGVMDTKGKTMFSGIKVVLCHGGKEPSPCFCPVPQGTSTAMLCPEWWRPWEETGGVASRSWGWALGCDAPFLLA